MSVSSYRNDGDRLVLNYRKLLINADNLADVFGYLQANITGNSTVAFVSEGNTYVFQDSGTGADTLVELVGVSATGLSTTGAAADSIWLV